MTPAERAALKAAVDARRRALNDVRYDPSTGKWYLPRYRPGDRRARVA